MKKIITSFVIALIAGATMLAQAQTITGTVTSSEDSQAVPGVAVFVKGTTVATSTDTDGRYSIKAKEGAVLVFSCLGFAEQEVTVGASNTINVTLKSDLTVLNESVVTALGMKREKKTLTYSVQDLKGTALVENQTANIASSLSGKIAGMQVTATAVPGGSNRIVIRGESSLNNNQPLIVVDGVPFDNSQGVGSTGSEAWGGMDLGDGLAMISNDDIESVSVLKGPSAAALYGSRGGAGVILITTKSGKKAEKPTVTFNSNFTFENVALQPYLQNEYGQGDVLGVYSSSSRASWGPAMGTEITHWRTGEKIKMSAEGNSFSSFMRTGTSWTNSVNVSGGTEKVNYRFGVSHLDQKGVIPNNGFKKTNATARVSAEILPGLTAEAKIQYANQIGNNRPYFSVSTYNPIFGLIYTPRSINITDMKDIFDENGKLLDWYYFATGKMLSTYQNPYALAYCTGNKDVTNRVTAHGSLKYKITDWLEVKGQYGIDTYNKTKDRHVRHGLSTNYTDGFYSTGTENFEEVNADFLVTAHKDKIGSSNFGFSASVGGNLMHRSYRSTSESATGLNVPELYTIANGKVIAASNSKSEKEIQSIYGMAHFEYNGFAFIDVTARNDWSSTLPKGKWSYFYPSVSGGLIVTDMLSKSGVAVPSWLTYTKIRAAYAQVGKDTDPYQLYPTMSTVSNMAGGQMGAALPSSRPNAELRPERQSGYELGLEARFLEGRIGFDFTWYDQTTKDQIISLPTSITTGYTSKYINAGKINNKGIELIVDAVPVETKDWNWKLSFNFAKNWSKVKELADGIDTYVLANPMGQNIQVVARVGQPYGEILTNGVKVDENGNQLISNGKYVVDKTLRSRGNMNPDWTGNLSSTLKFKGFDFNFNIDARIGGLIYLQSMMRLESNGQTTSTLPGRAEYLATGQGIVAEGIGIATGKANTVAIDPKSYYGQFYGNQGHYLYKTTNVRMREMSLGYTFPAKWFEKTVISGIKLSVVGNNLFFFYNALPGYDPECTFSTGNAQGVETCALPSTRRFGFNLNVTF